MKRGVRVIGPIAIAGIIVGLFAWLVNGKQIDVLQPAGVVADEQKQLLMFALMLSALVVVPVFTLLIFISVRYRAGNKKAKYDPNFNHNTILEAIWWGIPIAIIGILAVVTYQTSHSLDPYKKIDGGEALRVQVIGLQWKWLFIYPEYNLATLNYLAVPVNKPVHLSLTTQAPMSALWIPALGSQMYAMNGMDSQLNLKATKIGHYTGYNTNINGEGYAKMTFTTKVVSKDDFTRWRAKTDASVDNLDMNSFNKLAQPKAEHDERSYVLTDKTLYDTVMKRNMSHGSAHEEHH